MKNLNNILELLKLLKGDLIAKIGFVLLATGGAFLAPGFDISSTFQSVDSIVSFNVVQGEGWGANALGYCLVVSGLSVLLYRVVIFHKSVASSKSCLFFFVGFENQNENIPYYAIPQVERIGLVPIVHRVTSYDVNEIVNRYPYFYETIKERIRHPEASKGYLSALGAVPFLYLVGTMFRNGHLPLTILEHDREDDRWRSLASVGSYKDISIQCNERKGKDAISEIQPNRDGDIGIAISFTMSVKEVELPLTLQGHTLQVCLNDGVTGYDALPVERNQKNIAKDVAQLIAECNKKSNVKRVHLFICAQASWILELGRLYQNNMSGEVIVYNFDFKQKQYNWAVKFDGSPSVYR